MSFANEDSIVTAGDAFVLVSIYKSLNFSNREKQEDNT